MHHHNATVHECISPFSRLHLTYVQSTFLFVYNTVINGILNFVLNFFVVISLLYTRQLRIQAMRLIFFLSVSDICDCVSTSTLVSLLLWRYPNQYHCTIEILTRFTSALFGHTSGYIVMLIAVDRYARVQFMNRYKTIITIKRINKTIIFIVILSLIMASSYGFAVAYEFYDLVKYIVLSIDFIALTFTTVCYVLFTRLIKQHRRETSDKKVMKKIDKSTTKLTKGILLTSGTLYLLYIVLNALKSFLHHRVSIDKDGWIEMLAWIGLLMAHSNPSVNAIVFLCVNKNSRKFAKRVLRRQAGTLNTSLHSDAPNKRSYQRSNHDKQDENGGQKLTPNRRWKNVVHVVDLARTRHSNNEMCTLQVYQ